MVKITSRSLMTEVVMIFNFSSLTICNCWFWFCESNWKSGLKISLCNGESRNFDIRKLTFDSGTYSVEKYRNLERKFRQTKQFNINASKKFSYSARISSLGCGLSNWISVLCIACYLIRGLNFRNNPSPKLHVNRSFSFAAEIMLYIVNCYTELEAWTPLSHQGLIFEK